MFKVLLVPMILLLKTKHILSTDVQDIISTYDIVIINETPLVSRCSRYY